MTTVKYQEAKARFANAYAICTEDRHADPATLRELADASRALAALESEPERQIELRTYASQLERQRIILTATDFR